MTLPSLLAAAAEGAKSAIEFKLTGLDIAIMALAICTILGVGAFFARRQTGTKSYFLGGSSMPGWLVGFSITASMISAMTFLAIPGFTFKENWLWVLPSFSFLLLGFLSAWLIVPFFRRVNTPSGYAFLEHRYGTWARVYAGVGFMAFNLLRLGVVLYVTCIALDEFIPVHALVEGTRALCGVEALPGIFDAPIVWMILFLGIVATLYTMSGGFEAVVWTDFLQSMLFIFGGAVLLPTILTHIPGDFFGLKTIFEMAGPIGQNKMSFGSFEFNFAEKTFWVVIISTLFMDASNYTTRQDLIQRYRAPKNLFHARMAVIIGACTVVPIWIYFNFLGTALWTFYEINPSDVVETFRNSQPEKIVPFFMANNLPMGLKGLFLAAILAASLSTMAPMLNACTVTWVDDFYHRFIVRNKSDKHYMNVGRISTGLIGVLMITSATLIYTTRSQTLQNLQTTFAMVCSIGLFGLFMIGFFAKGVGNRSAKYAACVVVPVGLFWTVAYIIKTSPELPSSLATRFFNPEGGASLAELVSKFEGWQLAFGQWIPDIFWMVVFMNLLMIGCALGFAAILPKEKVDIDNLFPENSADKP